MPKEIKYATIPATFDETKHYIEQLAPVDMGDYIWVDVVVKDLDLTPMPEPIAPAPSEPYTPEPTLEERVGILEPKVETVQEAILALLIP
ncbi:MAG TPA: hypothetical protein VIK34_05710 [Clostridiaceae bacterium]